MQQTSKLRVDGREHLYKFSSTYPKFTGGKKDIYLISNPKSGLQTIHVPNV